MYGFPSRLRDSFISFVYDLEYAIWRYMELYLVVY